MISPFYGQLSPLRIPTRAPRGPVTDSDALAYIAAVETADGQSLEDAVKFAYEDFILGCKSDGTWSALKASCILAGARTLSGALVPLVGETPTNFNFVSADYNRETGLKGNGSTKYLNSNRNNDTDPQDNSHNTVWATAIASTNGTFIAARGMPSTVTNFIAGGQADRLFTRSRSSTGTQQASFPLAGFIGLSRSIPSNYLVRQNNSNNTVSVASSAPEGSSVLIFRRGDSITPTYGAHRLSFYSIGESLDLAALDNRVSTLMSDLAAAIP